MPQLIPNGPDIPDELIELWEDDRVVFFCGAGVSVRAGLPPFKGLVDEICERLRAPEQQRDSGVFLDRRLMQLERDFDPSLVRQAAVDILGKDNGRTDSHEALLKLASFRARDGLRLVTTNFDHLFERAADKLGLKVQCHTAPLLPIPRDDEMFSFNGLVYLHGRIGDDAVNGRLVLTSADFGDAYLIEGYARRFVARLLREFTVVFVGYSLNDPTLRYMTDAFAAEQARRRGGKPAIRAYIFRSSSDASDLPPGIEPIVYDAPDRDHRLLHDTLVAWAEWYPSRRQRVREAARGEPATLDPAAKSLVVWSILGRSREQGFGAAIFEELSRDEEGNPPPIGWLDILNKEENEKLKPYREEWQTWRERGSKGREPERPFTPIHDLLDPDRLDCRLSPTSFRLAEWLCHHLDKLELVEWLLARRVPPRLHPGFRAEVRRRLAQVEVPEPFKLFWSILSADGAWADPYPRGLPLFHHELCQRPWSPLLRQELLSSLEPRLHLGRSFRRLFAAIRSRQHGGPQENGQPLEFSHLADVEVKLTIGDFGRDILERTRGAWAGHFGELAFELTELTKRALDLLAMVNQANGTWDPSDTSRSVADSPEHVTEDWELLRPLLWQAWRELDAASSQASRALVQRWLAIPYPTFTRFALKAAGSSAHWTAEEALALLLADKAKHLWSGSVRSEVFEILTSIWPRLSPADRDRLVDVILSGPSGEEDQRWRDASIYARLWHLAEAKDPALPERAVTRLGELKHQVELAKERTPKRTAEGLLAHEDEQLIEFLKTSSWSREIDFEEKWREAIWQQRTRMLRLLPRLMSEPTIDAGVSISILWEMSSLTADEDLDRELITALQQLPECALRSQARLLGAACAKVEQLAEREWAEKHEPALLALWDKLLPLAAYEPARDENSDTPDRAEQTSLGTLANALLTRLWAREPKRGAGFPPHLRCRFDHLTDLSDETLRPALAGLAAYLPFLFAVDPAWTGERLLPAFDWNRDESTAALAWQSYLARGARFDIALWRTIRDHMLGAFTPDRLGKLSDEARRNIARMLMSAGVDLPAELLPRREVMNVIRAMTPEMRHAATWWLWRRVADEAKSDTGELVAESRASADRLWCSRVQPFIQKAWPLDEKPKDQEISENFIRMAIALSNQFGPAIEFLKPYMDKQLRISWSILHDLADSKHPETQPSSVLSLFEQAVGVEAFAEGDARDLLSRIEQANPALAERCDRVRARLGLGV